MNSLKIALSVGEKSGDYLGASLIKSIKNQFPEAIFIGLAGEEMKKEGVNSLFPIEDLSVMGLIDPLMNLKKIFKRRRELINYIIQEKPDIFIGIDSPSFNSGIAKKLKIKTSIKTIQYVCPQFWAWRRGRVKNFKNYLDHIFTLFPFESKLLEEEGVSANFTGHPLADLFDLELDKDRAKENMKWNSNEKYVALLPGSRKSELKHHLGLLIDVAKEFKEKRPDFKFVLSLTNESRIESKEFSNSENIIIKRGVTRDVLRASDYALIASGTASIEALFSKTPCCVLYKSNTFSNLILSSLLNIEFISLPNILANKKIIPELRQKNVSVENICNQLNKLVSSSNEQMIDSFREIHKTLKNEDEEKFIKPIKNIINTV